MENGNVLYRKTDENFASGRQEGAGERDNSLFTKIKSKFSSIEKKRFWEIFSLAAMCFLTAVMLFNPAEDLGDVFYVWLIPVFMLGAVVCFRKFRIFDLYADATRSDYIIAAVFAALFLIMSPLSEVVQLGCLTMAGKSVFRCIFVPFAYLFFLAALAALYGVLLFALRHVRESEGAESEGGKKAFWICFAAIAVVSAAFAAAGYPAVLNSDSVAIWNHNSDWHTIGFVAFTRLCMTIWYNPFSIIVAQTIIWILTNFLILKTLREYKGERAVILYTVLMLTVGLGVIKYLSTVYKDVVFSMFMLGYSVSAYRIIKKVNVKNLVFLAIYAAMASITRHMAVYVIAVSTLAIAIVYFVRRHPKIAMRICACCMVPAILVFAATRIYIVVAKAEKSPSYVTYTIPLYMLGAYAASGLEMSEETVTTMEKIMPVEDWITGYEKDPYYADENTRYWGNVGYRILEFDRLGLQGEVIRANLEFFRKAPVLYLETLFDVNSLVWEMSRAEGTYHETVIVDFETRDWELSEAIKLYPQWYPRDPNALNEFLVPVAESIYNIPVWRILAYRAGIHNWAILFGCVVTWKRNRELLLLALPFLLYGCSLLISLPAQDVRYAFPFIEFSILFAVLVFVKDRKGTEGAFLPAAVQIGEAEQGEQVSNEGERKDGQDSGIDPVL